MIGPKAAALAVMALALATSARADDAADAAAARKAQAEADKAEYDAQAAKYSAQEEKVKAANAGLAGSGISGKADAGTNAGAAEAAMLSALAINKTAKEIAGLMPNGSVVIFAGKDAPDLTLAQLFDLRVAGIEKSFTEANDAFDAAKNADSRSNQLLEFATPVLTGLSALSSIVSYFKTDYSVGGIAVATDDYMLAVAVAGEMKGRAFIAGQQVDDVASAEIQDRLAKLQRTSAAAADSRAKALARIAELTPKAPAKKKGRHAAVPVPPADPRIARYQVAADELDEAIARYDGFIADILGKPASGSGDSKKDAVPAKLPLDTIIAQESTRLALRTAGHALYLKVHSGAGGYYAEHNIWTGLGAMPFHVSGAAVVSYSEVSAKTGEVELAGLRPISCGYRTPAQVQKLVEAQSRPGFDLVAACAAKTRVND
ncbi:MAG: hypothetical protein ACHP7A_04830 [Caulobacterales bacterium]|jgi:hypothetical protein